MELRARPVEHSRADVLLAWLSRGGNGGGRRETISERPPPRSFARVQSSTRVPTFCLPGFPAAVTED